MTDLLRRPAGTAGSAPPRPAAVSGALAAAIVAGASLVTCLGLAVLGWLFADNGSIDGALRVGAGVWLTAHGSGVDVAGASITAVPLGLTGAIVFGTFSAARRLVNGTAVDGMRDLGLFAASAAIPYAATLGVTTVLASSDEASFGLVRVVLVGAALTAGAAFVGAATGSGDLASWWAAAPESVRSAIRGGAWASGALLAASVVMLVISLAMHRSTATAIFDGLDPGLTGGAGLALLCVLLLPNAVLFGTAFILGPGFTVGTGTAVDVGVIRVGDLPAFPLFAGVPEPGDQPGWMLGVALIPVLAGVLGGVRACVGTTSTGLVDVAVRGASAGAAGGLAVGLSLLCAGGSIGPGRMSELGPVAWCVPVAAVAMALGGALGAVAWHYREQRS